MSETSLAINDQLATAFVIWFIAVIPAFLLRYGMVKKPLSKSASALIAGSVWLLLFFLPYAIGELPEVLATFKKGHHAGSSVILVWYYFILRASPSNKGDWKKHPMWERGTIEKNESISNEALHSKSVAAAEGDGHLYAIVWQEIENGDLDTGLWAKAFASADGDEAKTKSQYIKLRVECEKSRLRGKSV